MGLMGAIAEGYNQAMPRIDARNQLAVENARAAEKQRMWLAQQQRQQDMYESELKTRAANRILASRPGLMKDYQDFIGPPDPQRQQVLDYADPQMLRQSINYKTDDEKLQDALQQLLAQETIKAQFKTPAKAGTDPLSMFKAVTGRMPSTLNELAAFAQSMKGKGGMDLTAFGPDGKPILSMGRGSMPPGTLTKGSEGTAQKKVMEAATGLDSADELLSNIKLDWFSGPTQLGMKIKGAVDKWGGGVGPETGKNLSEYSAGLSKLAKQANEEIHRLTGAQMSAEEADRLLKAIPNEKDSPAQALGKLQTFYNGLAMVQARYKFFLDQNRGAKPTEADFNSMSEPQTDPAKMAILAQYGYRPLSLEEIKAKIGTGFNQEQPPAASGGVPATAGGGQYDAESLIQKYGQPE